MTRMFTGIGIALALVGSAHAQDTQIVVKLQGKTHAAVRAEIYRAAQTVCADDARTVFDGVDSGCVEATYSTALHQLRLQRRLERTAVRADGYTVASSQ